MYKMVSYYRADTSRYPANARIIQVTPHLYALYITHDVVGVVYYRKGCLLDLEKQFFSFIPYGHTRSIFWKKVKSNGD